MAKSTKLKLDPDRVNSCLVVIRQLYQDYTPDEIVEAFAINRREIQDSEEKQRLANEINQLQAQYDELSETTSDQESDGNN